MKSCWQSEVSVDIPAECEAPGYVAIFMGLLWSISPERKQAISPEPGVTYISGAEFAMKSNVAVTGHGVDKRSVSRHAESSPVLQGIPTGHSYNHVSS
ncbi:hypothetical protein [Gynuella sp.]|uniref:hypothetical protein n=1 Tax=Gynuella sp. TaxID=2969146 RepID=UPI003D0FA64C